MGGGKSSKLKSHQASNRSSPKPRSAKRNKSAVSLSETSCCRCQMLCSESDCVPRQQCLYFLPLPQGQRSFRPVFSRGWDRIRVRIEYSLVESQDLLDGQQPTGTTFLRYPNSSHPAHSLR